MRVVFNHLLLRILDLASERLLLLTEQREIVRKWIGADEETRTRYLKKAERLIDDLLRNKDYVHSVLEALEESRPSSLTEEQDHLVEVIRKMFRWTLREYQSVVEYAAEANFDEHLLEELQKDQAMNSK